MYKMHHHQMIKDCLVNEHCVNLKKMLLVKLFYIIKRVRANTLSSKEVTATSILWKLDPFSKITRIGRTLKKRQ